MKIEEQIKIIEFADFGDERGNLVVIEGDGMDIPFDPNRAEFHKMMEPVNNVDYDVWIGKILHKTHIEVDRKGTKAAAVTAVEMDLAMAALPMEEHYITLDRPFVYAIVENETGYPMFLGTQNSMN